MWSIAFGEINTFRTYRNCLFWCTYVILYKCIHYHTKLCGRARSLLLIRIMCEHAMQSKNTRKATTQNRNQFWHSWRRREFAKISVWFSTKRRNRNDWAALVCCAYPETEIDKVLESLSFRRCSAKCTICQINFGCRSRRHVVGCHHRNYNPPQLQHCMLVVWLVSALSIQS